MQMAINTGPGHAAIRTGIAPNRNFSFYLKAILVFETVNLYDQAIKNLLKQLIYTLVYGGSIK